ncbi:MAG: histidine phosphatase family protein [Ruminococcaceae bacterium]|nr:histidine phosphatase family protein [Oscillospiraceae bacterium]
MRILFIRHGDPNYEDDCLTPLGHVQAKAAAERVKDEGISRIYSSTCGRAYETALYAAELLQLPVERLEFMRELDWCWDDAVFGKGQPWVCSEDILRRCGADAFRTERVWREHEYFTPEPLIARVDAAVEGFDGVLAQHGYVRCGDVYRCVRPSDETIAMYSHGGSSSAVVAHMLNISFPQFCTICQPERTSITSIVMKTNEEGLAIPLVEIMNDHRHILGLFPEGEKPCVSYS